MKSKIAEYIIRQIENKIGKILDDALSGSNNEHNTVYHYRTSLKTLVDEVRTILEEFNR